ncbi:Failed axon connections-like-like protein [Cladobotryum mycophilum]|uniref:Failed axon connections-like-like protein n=1 Tax=Cladobotryum mycophilum TaxID=491253 RepID=A0ABR0SKI9_9HYPO
MSTTATPNVVLYRGFPSKGTYVWSPFVIKLEARLRFAGLRYHVEQGSTSKAPRGKVPYLEIAHGGESVSIGDSSLIVKHLIEADVCEDLNAKLSPSDRARDATLRAFLEDKLYFFGTYEKWNDNYYTMRSGVLSAVPWPLQILVGLLAYRSVSRTLYGQGTGRFTSEEVAGFRRESWEHINALVTEVHLKSPDGQSPFWVLGGQTPSEADSVVFGFIVAGLVCDAAPDTQNIINGYPALTDYAERIHRQYFSEYSAWKGMKE